MARDEAPPVICPQCKGTGMVSYWNEVAYFEDRRSCTRCGVGRELEARIGEIIARSRLLERFSG